MIKKDRLAALGLLLILAGCESKKVAQAPEPPAQNAFTEYVDNGARGLQKAQTVADQMNARSAQENAQAQAAANAQ